MLEFYLLNPKPDKTEEKKTDAKTKKVQRKTVQVAIAGRVLDYETRKAIAGAKLKITQILQGVADFGYDLYLLAVAQLLISKYSRLLSFYFHTLIEQRLLQKDSSKLDFNTFVSLKGLQYGSQWKNMTNRPDLQITASDGSFYFCNLPPGKYTLAVFLPGSETRYEKKEVPVDISEPEKINVKIYDPKEINVEKSDIYNEEIEIIPTKILDIFLSPTGIKGTITGEKNQPIVNAKVQIQGSRESAFTNKKGEYQLLGLLASKSDKDKYTIIVSANGYQKKNSRPLELKQGKVINQNFFLEKRNPKLS
ncbi:MAG: carboxypeptidase regulatory-like domain-containing protein [Okeania sp. SIO2D1]|nr:carboxypeptidase regulatory-like domain-containing protein [Okeania sp. SIO2D1]